MMKRITLFASLFDTAISKLLRANLFNSRILNDFKSDVQDLFPKVAPKTFKSKAERLAFKLSELNAELQAGNISLEEYEDQCQVLKDGSVTDSARLPMSLDAEFFADWTDSASPITTGAPTFNKARTYKFIKGASENKENKDHKSYYNSTFAIYDLETVTNSKGILVPYLLGWTVAKWVPEEGMHQFISKVEYLTLNPSSEDIQKALVKMFTDLAQYKTKGDFYLLAHNGGRFDIKVILNPLLKLDAEQGVIRLGKLITDPAHDIFQVVASFEKANGYIVNFILRDSFKLMCASAANLGKLFLDKDQQKLDCNHDILNTLLVKPTAEQDILVWGDEYKLALKYNPYALDKVATPLDHLIKYCKMDCVLIARALIKFTKTMDENHDVQIPLASLITIASAALCLWGKKYNNYKQNPIMEIQLNSATAKDIKKSYIGGRTETFHSGMNLPKIYHFDVPGMYALAMKSSLPIGNPVFIGQLKAGLLFKDFMKFMIDNKLIGFLTCTVTTPKDLHIPVLGIKYQGKLVFPLGTFTGMWCTKELELALEMGYEISLISGYVFKSGTPLKDYSIKLTELKDAAQVAGDPVSRNVNKSLLNNLYGKFASSYYQTSTVIVPLDEVCKLEKMFEIVSMTHTDSNLVFVTYYNKPLPNIDRSTVPSQHIDDAFKAYTQATMDKSTNIAIASAISSEGRVMLYKLMMEVQARGGVHCYSDTDSIYAYMPESPFNKPFGPFIWDGKPEDNTYTKALFLAPKMYMTISESGIKTFKVKGVNTKKGQQYSYEQLLEMFLNRAKITFDHQLAFKDTKVQGKYMGLAITEELVKTYDIYGSIKRDWNKDEKGTMFTTPKLVDPKIAVVDTKKVADLTNIENIVALTCKEFSPNVVDKSSATFSKGGIDVHINREFNTVNVEVAELKLHKADFSDVWMYILGTIAHNTDKLTSLTNLDRMVVVVSDGAIFKTIATFPGSNWIALKPDTIMSTLLTKIQEMIIEYDNLFSPEKLHFKLYFKTHPSLIQSSNMLAIYNKVVLKIVDHEAEKAKLAKLIKESQEQLEKLSDPKAQESFKALQKELEQIYPAVQNFKQKAYSSICGITNKLILQATDKPFQPWEVKELNNSIFNAFEKTIIDNAEWTVHTLYERIMDYTNMSREDESDVKLGLKISFTILATLLVEGLLRTTALAKDPSKPAGHHDFKTTNKYIPADSAVFMWLSLKYITDKICLTPHHVSYKDHSSKTMVDTLNKLNATPVSLNVKYYEWLMANVFKIKGASKDQWFVKMGLNTKEEQDSMLIAMMSLERVMTTIFYMLNKFGTDTFYMKWTHDFRGRLYPKMTQFSHMSHKFLRPLFLLKSRNIELAMLEAYFAGDTQLMQDPLYKNYVTILDNSIGKGWAKKFFREIVKTSYARKVAMIEEVTKYTIENKFDFKKVNRALEVITLLTEGKVMPAPYQLDATCNVMQHISTLTNNVEIMKTVGLKPRDGTGKDFYITIADETIRQLEEHCIESGYIIDEKYIAAMEIKNCFVDDNYAKLRQIVKRPAMTKAYSATYLTSYAYIRDELRKQNIVFSKTTLKLFVDMIIMAVSNTISTEETLMWLVQQTIKKYPNAIWWNMNPNSDFTIVINNLKAEIKPIHLSVKVEVERNGVMKTLTMTTHTNSKILSQEQNPIKNKNSIFVNIIHSLDALHMGMIIKDIKHSALPIHDAMLIPMEVSIYDTLTIIHSTFNIIHELNKTFKNIMLNITEQVGNSKVMEIINMIQPPILREDSSKIWKME